MAEFLFLLGGRHMGLPLPGASKFFRSRTMCMAEFIFLLGGRHMGLPVPGASKFFSQ